MFYHILFPLAEYVGFFNVFQYLTVRGGGALMTSFVMCVLIGPGLINALRVFQHGQNTVKEIAHSKLNLSTKAGTPTMGGLMILASLVVSVLLWADLTNPYVWLLLGVTFSFGCVGLLDDFFSITRRWRNGLPGRLRLAIQSGVSLLVLGIYLLVYKGADATAIYLPFFKDAVIDIGIIGFLLFGTLVIVGSANAVNLTDGLDGLVSIPTVIVAMALALIAYMVGRVDFSEYLLIAHIPGAGEIFVVLLALAGGALGFLWYNAPPARLFMGDTGALMIGSLLGTAAVLIKQEFVLAVIGGIFVLETLSVIIQVISYKTTGKRVFRMAPLHHHFEQLGWPETTVVVRFWILSILLAIIGLATLKLR